MNKVKLGTYEHYKGDKCTVLGVAKHSEALEEMVVYTHKYENELSAIWVRPLEMFLENVVVDGKKIPRFKKID
jgi:hypothetical protein